MTIRFGGISSGLDTASMVQQLMQLESRPLIQIQNKKTMAGLKQELLSEVSSSLSAFQGKVSNLVKASTWNQLKATSSNEDVVTITKDEDSVMGSYQLEVTKLATVTSVLGSELVAGVSTAASTTSTAAVGSSRIVQDTFAAFEGSIKDGTITINDVTFTIDVDNTKIDEFMNQVNSSSAGVTISYDDTSDKFTIQTKDIGSDEKISISDKTDFFNAINIDPSITYQGSGTVDTSAKLVDTSITGLSAPGGTFYFKINDYSFSFDESIHSLNSVIDTVNSSGAGVSMIYDSELDKVIISNKEKGDNYINFEDIQGNLLESMGVYVPGDEPATQAKQTLGDEASFKLNGVAMTRDSNEFEINGVTFNLKSVGNSTVNVENNTDATYNSIKEFVDQYNSTISLLNARLSEEKVNNATTEISLRKGLLRADSTIMGIRSKLREINTSNVNGLTNIYDSLMEIGITTSSDDFGKSGLLEIDETKLKDALENNFEGVKKLFFEDLDDDDNVDDGEIGLAATLYNELEGYVSSSTTSYSGRTYKVGILPMRIDSMEQLISEYDDQIEDFEDRLVQIEERYWRQFNAMEQALSRIQNQGNWLSSQLATLPTISNG